MSDECTLDDDEDERPWDEVIREASARFSAALSAMVKAPPPDRRARNLEAVARYRSRKKAALGETPEQYKARRSALAKAREEQKRAARGNTCINGHAVPTESGDGMFSCIACRRARQGRVNEMRRLRTARAA